MDPFVAETKKKIDKVLDVLKGDLATIRTGRATPSLVENITIIAYEGSAKLKVMELATIGAQDTQTLIVTPFDAATIHDIQKGIEGANTGLNPIIDGTLLRISIPPLSTDRRQELIKAMKHKLENGKIMVRQVRHDAMTDIKRDYEGREDDIKRLEKDVQRVVDETMETIESYGKQKEAELLQI